MSDSVVHNRIHLISSVTVPVTEELVERFANMNPSITERPLDDERVDFITSKIAEGSALPFMWAFAMLNGIEYRVNGHHSSVALEEMLKNGTQLDGLMAHIDEYGVKDEAELVHLFRQFDPRKSGRSPLDVANAYASVVPGLNGIPRDILKLAAEGINWGTTMVDRLPPLKADDRYQALMEERNLGFLQWIAGVFTIKTPEMRQISVVAAMYKTYFIDPEHANTFWSSVARGGDEYNEQDTARQLDLWLQGTKVKRVKEGKLVVIRPAQYYNACIFAWNAYVDGKPVKAISDDTKKGLHEPKYPA